MYYDNNYLINELYNNINNNNLNDENKAIFRNNDKNSNISNKETNNNSNSIQLFKDQKNSKIMVTIGNPIERNNLKMKIEQLKMMDNNDLSLTHSSYMIQSWQCQNQLISPINLISLVLLSYRNNKDGISSNKIQNYLILFKKELFNLGFNLDFNENEDSSAVLNYALNLIGEQRLTIKLGEEDNEDNEEVDGLLNYKVNRVYLNDDIDSILYLNLLTKPIIPIFLFESIFILSYYYTHKKYSSQPEYQGFITKQQVEIEFSKIIKLILNLYPEIIIYLKQYTIEMLFNKFIKCNYIQLLDQFIIMNISPNTMDYFHILLTLLHSKLDTFWIVLAGLSSLKQDQSMSYDQFYTMIQHVIYNGIHNNYLHYKESISKEFIHLAIKNCESLKLIEIKDKHINILNANNQFENQLIEITAFVEKLCNLTNQRHQLPKPKVKLDIINENGTIAEDVINPTIAVIDNSILSQNLIKLFQSNISKVLHSTTNNNNFQSWFNWSNYFNPFDTNAFPSPISRKNSIS
ncbi:hypothetical protein K502DRAFT_324169 [Neoconidiobolus thromboides FSU 785]|nr:hypothetical protein K502DRAFT_324169 [Neoconidiobolus thromboides FSU 785]